MLRFLVGFFYPLLLVHVRPAILPLFSQSSVLVVLLSERRNTDSNASQYHRQVDALMSIHSSVAGNATSKDLCPMRIVPR